MNDQLKRILLFPFNLLNRISPKLTLKVLFYFKQGYRLNLKDPKTYNEKLNWLKLNYRNDLMPICADKYTVRKYVKDKGLKNILNELYWEGFNPEKIPFDDLPDQFVIKVTNGSGKNIICKDKSELDQEKTKKLLKKWLSEKYLPAYGEWFYDVIKPRIIIEKLLLDRDGNIPKDYKLFCFNNINGKHGVAFTGVDLDRFGNRRRNVYDKEWNFLKDVNLIVPNNPNVQIDKPKPYDEMIVIAKKLSKQFPHARIDLYIVDNQIYFGEITFTGAAGFGNIKPMSFQRKMGDWISLENV